MPTLVDISHGCEKLLMTRLFDEISEIPDRVEDAYRRNTGLQLPQGCPYLGMGASYFAPLTLLFCGAQIAPHIASEYFYYLGHGMQDRAVLLSQSGMTSELLWNQGRFRSVVVVTNDPGSPIAISANTETVVDLSAGREECTSTKTYANMLIALYLGLGIDPRVAVDSLQTSFQRLRASGEDAGRKISEYMCDRSIKGLYVVGSGPNLGTAYQGALTLSETTKRSWTGLALAQYDHGPKETATDSVVVMLNGGGPTKRRIAALRDLLEKRSNALVLELSEHEVPENLTPLSLIVQLNFCMCHLADVLSVGDAFQIGTKVVQIGEG